MRQFLRRNFAGVIVNTASFAAKIGAPLLAHYSASKFAVLGWTQALAREMAPHRIGMNAVCPGLVATGMQQREVGWEAKLRGMTPEGVIADYVAQTPLSASRNRKTWRGPSSSSLRLRPISIPARPSTSTAVYVWNEQTIESLGRTDAPQDERACSKTTQKMEEEDSL